MRGGQSRHLGVRQARHGGGRRSRGAERAQPRQGEVAAELEEPLDGRVIPRQLGGRRRRKHLRCAEGGGHSGSCPSRLRSIAEAWCLGDEALERLEVEAPGGRRIQEPGRGWNGVCAGVYGTHRLDSDGCGFKVGRRKGRRVEGARVPALGLAASATLVAVHELILTAHLKLSSPLARCLEAVPAIPHRVVRAAIEARCDSAPLEAELLDAGADDLVLSRGPWSEALVSTGGGSRAGRGGAGWSPGRGVAFVIAFAAAARATLIHDKARCGRGGLVGLASLRDRQGRSGDELRLCIYRGVRGFHHIDRSLAADGARGRSFDGLARLATRIEVGGGSREDG
mmetsp:Transcript_13294/g.32259  ORF Transcript_13294/g.32259 Transcript_13294/m.32259 type:complete len:340 (-) Transcript_13294:333-1352(-)